VQNTHIRQKQFHLRVFTSVCIFPILRASGFGEYPFFWFACLVWACRSDRTSFKSPEERLRLHHAFNIARLKSYPSPPTLGTTSRIKSSGAPLYHQQQSSRASSTTRPPLHCSVVQPVRTPSVSTAPTHIPTLLLTPGLVRRAPAPPIFISSQQFIPFHSSTSSTDLGSLANPRRDFICTATDRESRGLWEQLPSLHR
jgi:hypothetical protein